MLLANFIPGLCFQLLSLRKRILEERLQYFHVYLSLLSRQGLYCRPHLHLRLWCESRRVITTLERKERKRKTEKHKLFQLLHYLKQATRERYPGISVSLKILLGNKFLPSINISLKHIETLETQGMKLTKAWRKK